MPTQPGLPSAKSVLKGQGGRDRRDQTRISLNRTCNIAFFSHFIPVKLTIPPPENYDNKIGLFFSLWVIHSGDIYGQIGKLIVDAFALAFIFLLITGLIHFIAPGMLRRKKKKQKHLLLNVMNMIDIKNCQYLLNQL